MAKLIDQAHDLAARRGDDPRESGRAHRPARYSASTRATPAAPALGSRTSRDRRRQGLRPFPKAPVLKRVTAPHTPVPFAPSMEKLYIRARAEKKKIAEACARSFMGTRGDGPRHCGGVQRPQHISRAELICPRLLRCARKNDRRAIANATSPGIRRSRFASKWGLTMAEGQGVGLAKQQGAELCRGRGTSRDPRRPKSPKKKKKKKKKNTPSWKRRQGAPLRAQTRAEPGAGCAVAGRAVATRLVRPPRTSGGWRTAEDRYLCRRLCGPRARRPKAAR